MLESARVLRQFPYNSLRTLLPLSTHSLEFQPTEKLTLERLQELNVNSDSFFWPEEEKLFQHIISLNQEALAFKEKDRGTLKESYFSLYIIPTVPHTLWTHYNILIPPEI